MGGDRPLHRHDPGPKLTARSTETDGWIQRFWGTILARPPNNSLQLTRLACGKLERDLPAELRENGEDVA